LSYKNNKKAKREKKLLIYSIMKNVNVNIVVNAQAQVQPQDQDRLTNQTNYVFMSHE
jgi:hypothetical protein